jgi:hypothetical protein
MTQTITLTVVFISLIIGFTLGWFLNEIRCPAAGYLEITPEEDQDAVHICIETEMLEGHKAIRLDIKHAQE